MLDIEHCIADTENKLDVYVQKISREMGLGVFAGRDFQPGELVLRATGVVMDHQTIYSIQVDWDRHLDPDSPAKFLNHCCDPNLGVRSGAGGLPDFFARRPIRKGEPVTFDYAMTEFRHYTRPNLADDFDLTCLCGDSNCRGRLGYFSELSDEIKKHYQGCFAGYLARSLDKTGIEVRGAAHNPSWHTHPFNPGNGR